MADQSSIEWTDSTFNPWIGCTKVGPGCDHCYAERDMDHRRGRAKWGAGQPRSRTSADYWKQPLRWNGSEFCRCIHCGWRGEVKLASWACPNCLEESGWAEPARRRVFCASLADVFDNEVDPTWRRDLFDLISATPRLDWLLLTKRIGIANRLFRECHVDVVPIRPWPENVWLGATVVNQEEVERDVPKLLQVPARVRFLSIEPMLGPVDLRDFLGAGAMPSGWCHGLSWIICGGESGPGARPMHPTWARSLRDQCAGAGVPFLFKQWGEWGHVLHDWLLSPERFIHWPDGEMSGRIGKKNAGRLLDGVQHDGSPA